MAQSKSLKALQSPLKLSLRTALHSATVHRAASQMTLPSKKTKFKKKKRSFSQVLDSYCCLQLLVNSFYHFSLYPGERRNNKREGEALSCSLHEMEKK